MDIGAAWILGSIVGLIAFFVGMWITSLYYRTRDNFEVFNVSVNAGDESLKQEVSKLRESITFHGPMRERTIAGYFGPVSVGMEETPVPQLKDRIRLIEETLGIQYEHVPAKPKVPETWKAKKKRKART